MQNSVPLVVIQSGAKNLERDPDGYRLPIWSARGQYAGRFVVADLLAFLRTTNSIFLFFSYG
ncbi:MAG: hypothetical protein JST90_16365 [Bacteroidetes bacterium]|nr:hypothetical protein [Bacteroidota bacterium]